MARKGLYLGGSALLLAVVLLLVFWGLDLPVGPGNGIRLG